jgi:hypothetical protein
MLKNGRIRKLSPPSKNWTFFVDVFSHFLGDPNFFSYPEKCEKMSKKRPVFCFVFEG